MIIMQYKLKENAQFIWMKDSSYRFENQLFQWTDGNGMKKIASIIKSDCGTFKLELIY